MKRIALFLLYIIAVNTATAQQSKANHEAFAKFFNLTADEVKIDSMLPQFGYQVELGPNYEDSIYEVSIAYPEFIDMSPTDIKRYHALSMEALPEMPAIEQSISVDRRKGFLSISMMPLVMRSGKYQKLVSFMLRIQSRPIAKGRAFRAAADASSRYAAHSVLANGQWAKISIPETGIYQLTDELIRQAGFSNPSKVKIYGYGGALQPEILTGDYLKQTDDLKEVATCNIAGKRLFFGIGPVNWKSSTEPTRQRNNYATLGYYFLTENDATPLTLSESEFTSTYSAHPNNYHSLVEPEEYSWYHGGRNLYANEPLPQGNGVSYTLTAGSNSGKLFIRMSYDGYCEATVAVNGTAVGTILVNKTTTEEQGVSYFNKSTYSSVAAYTWTFDVASMNIGDNTVTIRKTSGANMRLDNITLTSTTPKAMPSLSSATLPTPTFVSTISNQDHHADSAIDLLIIIPASGKLYEQAQRIAKLHEEKDAMRVRIVRADELYNEFSSGTPDANAYRRYLKMLYDRAATSADMPKYLLLMGDCGWDNRMVSTTWKNYSPDDFLLCYESENSFSNVYCYVSDDYFCLLDDGERIDNYQGKPDVAVGRIPARTVDEAKIVVDKTVAYRNNEYAGSWQNLVCVIGDDGDENQHMIGADTVANIVRTMHPSYQVKKIYWDTYPRTTSATGNSYPSARRALLQQMRDGALIMNYNGHGGPHSISHEQVIILNDFITNVTNNLPLWVTASCDIIPYDTQQPNIGEKALFNGKGGCIAFFGTPRTVFMDRNLVINKTFTRHVLANDASGRLNTIAEAVRLTKNELVTSGADRTINKMNYAFVGDPALRLAAPTADIIIDSINGKHVSEMTQKLSAGSRVTVKGHVEGIPSFNGVSSIVIHDAEETVVCLKQNSSSAFTYQDRPNIIYSGRDSVQNGKFSFTFAVPRDISYSDEQGQIIVYAVNNEKTITAHGQQTNFCMNGTDESAADGTGPSIYCYLNNRAFTNGCSVNTTPYFYAELNDKDGINASGGGIGHDIELVIDGDMARTYVLNDYFKFNFGDYTSGTIGFSIPALEAGTHKLLIRAWDTQNNSSTSELTFVVDPTLAPNLLNIVCVRNPANTNTRFLITHDRIGSQMDITLEIYDTSGRILWRRTETGLPTDEVYTVDWDLTTNMGRLAPGVYLYRVLAKTSGSNEASAAQKLIVTK